MATAVNTAAVSSIAAPAAAVGSDITHVNLWDAETGGNWLQEAAISTNPSALALGERLELAAGALEFEVAEEVYDTSGTLIATLSPDMAERHVRGAIAGGVWIAWHTGLGGNNHTSNAVTSLGRTQNTEANFTVAQ